MYDKRFWRWPGWPPEKVLLIQQVASTYSGPSSLWRFESTLPTWTSQVTWATFFLGEQTTVPWKGSNSSSEFGSVASSLLHSAQALAQSKAHREGLENHSCFLNEISSPLYHGLFSSHQFPNLLKSSQNKTGLDKVKRTNNNLDIWITWAATFHFQKPAGLWVKWAVWKRNFSDWKRNCCCQQGGAHHVFNTTPCWFLFPYFLYSQWGLHRGRFFPRSTQSTLARWAKDHFSSVFLKTTSFSL